MPDWRKNGETWEQAAKHHENKLMLIPNKQSGSYIKRLFQTAECCEKAGLYNLAGDYFTELSALTLVGSLLDRESRSAILSSRAASCYRNCGRLAEELDGREQVIEYLLRQPNADSDHIRGNLLRIGICHRELGHHSESAAAFDRADQYPLTPREQAKISVCKGNAYEKQRNWAAAAKCFIAAYEYREDPNRQSFDLARAGKCYALLGKYEKACQLWDLATDLLQQYNTEYREYAESKIEEMRDRYLPKNYEDITAYTKGGFEDLQDLYTDLREEFGESDIPLDLPIPDTKLGNLGNIIISYRELREEKMAFNTSTKKQGNARKSKKAKQQGKNCYYAARGYPSPSM